MRSYGQYCALARALDVVGERWTMLIIRELFFRDSRYSDLRDALPGIATNLLAERLRRLETDGVIERYEAPRPVRATVYRLTPRGHQLGPALSALVGWGAPLLVSGQGGDAFRSHWLALALPIVFDSVDVSDLAPLSVVLETGDEPITIDISDEGISVHQGAPAHADRVVVNGSPEATVALLNGTNATTVDGVRIHGPDDAIRRLHELVARSRLAGQRSPPLA